MVCSPSLQLREIFIAVSVEDNNHHVQSQDVIIPADAGVEKNVDLVFDNLRDATPEQNDKLVSVTGKVGTGEGIMLDEVEFSVFNKTTGERVPAQFKNGLLTFLAIKGNIYSVSVEDNNHQVQSQDVTIADNAGADENIDLTFDNKGDAATDQVQRLVPVNKRIKTADGNMLDEVTVTVFDKATGERVYSQFENGLLKFAGISGNIYAVSIEDKNHNIQSQDIAIPADATGEQNADLILGDQDNTMANEDEGKRIPVVGEIMVAEGNMLDEVEVTVSDKATGERIPSQFKNGLLSFIGVKGNIYSVAVQEGNQPARIEEVVIQENAVNPQRVSIPFDDATNTLANTGAATTLGSNDQQVAVTGRLSRRRGDDF